LIILLMAAGLFGVRVLGRLLGVILTADGVAEATSPMLIGYLRDHSASYQSGFLALIAVALAGTVAIAMLPRRRAGPVQSRVGDQATGVPLLARGFAARIPPGRRPPEGGNDGSTRRDQGRL